MIAKRTFIDRVGLAELCHADVRMPLFNYIYELLSGGAATSLKLWAMERLRERVRSFESRKIKNLRFL